MKATLTPTQLNPGEYQPYFQTYIDLAGETNVLDSMKSQLVEIKTVFSDLDNDVAQTVHAPYQWNLKQVLGHLIDGEKIFGCRAHRIACQECQPLPGFDQDIFVTNTSYEHVPIQILVSEFELIRESNRMMFERWTETMWQQVGKCDGKTISVRAIACLLIGHVNHHLSIVRRRLGIDE